jgi:L-iditol 2-dehydrogenase
MAKPPSSRSLSARVAEVDASQHSVRVVPRSIRPPEDGEIRLRLIACGLCGTDLFKLDNGVAPEGAVLGHELVGEVESVGPGEIHFDVGDRVVVPHHVACGVCALCLRGSRTLCPVFKENLFDPGGFSEALVVGPRAVHRAMRHVPDGLSDAAATFLEPAACVLRGVDKADLTTDRPVSVVLGAGSMGLLHLLVLRAVAPEGLVIVVDPIADRQRIAETLGAQVAVAPEAAASAVHDVSRGLGADAVFDTVGGAALLRHALQMTRPGGVVVLFAHAADGETADFELNPLFKNERRVVATYSGTLEEQGRIAELLFRGTLDPSPLVSHTLPLSRMAEAVEMARRREALKIMVVPG